MSSTPNKNCEEILAKEIEIDQTNRNQILIDIEEAAEELIGCGIDMIDYELIFEASVMLNLSISDIVERRGNKMVLTYAQLLKSIQKITNQEHYQKAKKSDQARFKLYTKPADIANWDQDKILLEEIGKGEAEIEAIFEVLKVHSDPSQSYQSFLQKYQLQIVRIKNMDALIRRHSNITASLPNYYILSIMHSYHEVYLLSKETNKPILFYCTRLSNKEARKMEHLVLDAPEIWKIIEDQFIFYPLFLDDDTAIFQKELYHPTLIGKKLVSMRGRNTALLYNTFKMDSQLFFAIVNSEEEILERLEYTLDKDVFLKFLEKGLQK